MSEVKKVITQVDKSTKAMTGAAATLQKVANEMVALADTSASLSFDIEAKSSELNAIQDNITSELRTAKAELNIKVLENEDAVLSKLMNNRGYAVISSAELDNIRRDLSNALADNSDAIAEAVAKAEKSAAIANSASKAKLEAEHAVETATLKADNASLESKIEFLTESNTSYKQQIEAERNARVEMAKNTSQPVVNVQSGK